MRSRFSAAMASPLAVVFGIGGLYVAQSVIGGITWTALPAVMRSSGAPHDRIGLLSLVALPWALKFLWSPLVERYRLPANGGDRSALFVALVGGLSLVGLVAAGFADPAAPLPLLAALTVVAFAASTVDIVCDGYAVQNLTSKDHGWGNAAQVGGAYLGSAIGGGLMLLLVDAAGWNVATATMALVVLVLGVPFLVVAAGHRTVPVAHAHVPRLSTALRRPEMRRGLACAAVFVLAQKGALGMVGPFLVDKGLSLTTVGLLNGTGSMVVGLGAALAGGGAVRVFGVRPVLLVALLLQAACLLAFAFIARSDVTSLAVLVPLAVASTSGILAFGFVALYAQFMRWSDPRQAGVDFTLFQCMDALVSMGAGVAAGYLAGRFGYGTFFTLAAALAMLAVPVMGVAARSSTGSPSQPISPQVPRRQ